MKNRTRKITVTLPYEDWITVLRCMHVAITPAELRELRSSEMAMESVGWATTRQRLIEAVAKKTVKLNGGGS